MQQVETQLKLVIVTCLFGVKVINQPCFQSCYVSGSFSPAELKTPINWLLAKCGGTLVPVNIWTFLTLPVWYMASSHRSVKPFHEWPVGTLRVSPLRPVITVCRQQHPSVWEFHANTITTSSERTSSSRRAQREVTPVWVSRPDEAKRPLKRRVRLKAAVIPEQFCDMTPHLQGLVTPEPENE